METKIIACPEQAAELESLAKFAAKQLVNNKVGLIFVLKQSNNACLEMFQKISEQGTMFELVTAKESDTIDNMIVQSLQNLNGANALILRSMQFENWNFLLEMLSAKRGNTKVVYYKESGAQKLDFYLNKCADFFAKYLYGIHLYDGSISAVLIDAELIKLAQTFPVKTNMLLKTNSFFGYEKLSIEKDASFVPKLYALKKDLIVFLSVFAGFVAGFLTQIVVNIFAGNLVVFNIIGMLVNAILFVSSVLFFASYCIRRRVGKLIL